MVLPQGTRQRNRPASLAAPVGKPTRAPQREPALRMRSLHEPVATLNDVVSHWPERLLKELEWSDHYSSQSSTSDSEPPKKQQNTRQRISLRRKIRYLEALRMKKGKVLETLAVQPRTHTRYRKSWKRFRKWADKHGKPLVVAKEVDATVVGYMNELFLDGCPLEKERPWWLRSVICAQTMEK